MRKWMRFRLRTLMIVVAIVGAAIVIGEHLSVDVHWNQFTGYGTTDYVTNTSSVYVEWVSSATQTRLFSWGTNAIGQRTWHVAFLWWAYGSKDGYRVDDSIQWWLPHCGPGRKKDKLVDFIPEDER